MNRREHIEFFKEKSRQYFLPALVVVRALKLCCNIFLRNFSPFSALFLFVLVSPFFFGYLDIFYLISYELIDSTLNYKTLPDGVGRFILENGKIAFLSWLFATFAFISGHSFNEERFFRAGVIILMAAPIFSAAAALGGVGIRPSFGLIIFKLLTIFLFLMLFSALFEHLQENTFSGEREGFQLLLLPLKVGAFFLIFSFIFSTFSIKNSSFGLFLSADSFGIHNTYNVAEAIWPKISPFLHDERVLSLVVISALYHLFSPYVMSEYYFSGGGKIEYDGKREFGSDEFYHSLFVPYLKKRGSSRRIYLNFLNRGKISILPDKERKGPRVMRGGMFS